MVDREVWEQCVKKVRDQFLSKTTDPDFRRITAGIMDAAFDTLYSVLAQEDKDSDGITLTVDQFDQAADREMMAVREIVTNAPEWLDNILSAFVTSMKCDLFYPEKED